MERSRRFCWLLHKNSIRARFQDLGKGRSSGFLELRRLHLLYADDVAFALSHPNPRVLVRAVGVAAGIGERSLDGRDLSANVGKSAKLILSPPHCAVRLFRRPWDEGS